LSFSRILFFEAKKYGSTKGTPKEKKKMKGRSEGKQKSREHRLGGKLFFFFSSLFHKRPSLRGRFGVRVREQREL